MPASVRTCAANEGEPAVVAMRRPHERDDETEERDFDDTLVEQSPHTVPRWIVVSGLVLYCSAFWAVLYFAGAWVLSLFRS